jgi:hypothetical protein
MARWSFMLSGFLLWALHFAGLYAIASVEAETAHADMEFWRTVALAFSIACLSSSIGVALWTYLHLARARSDGFAFHRQLAALGGVVAAIAITWQTLPLLLG